MNFRSFFRQYFAVLFVGATYVWSMIAIVSYRSEQTPPGTKITLRIGHWQLEAGVREGFRQLAAEYQKLHPEVYIVQDAIPETTYGPWLTTQVMGGTASDIIEVGMLPAPLMLSFHSRYFLPLTSAANQPNPYNAGTPQAGEPWRKTFKDGMRSGYVEELQEYMMVSLSQFAYRIIYNHDLLKKLTGRDEPPHNYRDFLQVCETIRRQTDEAGRAYVPVVGSSYHTPMWDGMLCEPLTFAALRQLDFNRDGTVGSDELYAGMATHRISFEFPPYAARFQMLRELTHYMPTGFAGLGRDEGVFLFAQQRAVFIASGTYDAASLMEQARGSFAAGVMDFPVPAPDDPEFGHILEGPVYDHIYTGFTFAITRSCQHPEAALDFLRFVSSRQGNAELNRAMGWIPAVRGVPASGALAGFEPHLEGVYPAMPALLGGGTTVRWQQLYSLFLVNQISYADFASQFTEYYLAHGPEEFAEQQRNRQRGMVRDEQTLSALRAQAMLEPGASAEPLWIRYRHLEIERLLQRELAPAWLNKMIQNGPVTNAVGPYEFTAAALDNLGR